MNAERERTLATPVGELTLVATEHGLLEIRWPGQDRRDSPPSEQRASDRADEILDEAVHQLEEYFAGDRRTFDLPLTPRGTAFQLQAWRALREIPYGETRSYGEQAARIGRPTAYRAVGAANGRNPLSIVVPCHRVVGAAGSLTGFRGGLDIKRWLLEHERAHCGLAHPPMHGAS